VVVYAFIYIFGTFYLTKLLRAGPNPPSHYVSPQAARDTGRPKRPLSKPDETLMPGE
jgi:cytochrome d ubiquinol oxidase subunit I